MLLDLIFIFIIFGCGYALGEFVAVYRVHKFLIRISKKAGIDLEKEVDNDIDSVSSVPKLTTEIVNDIIYLYEHEDNTFVCQGKSMEELAKVSHQFNKIENAIVLHKESIFIFSNGTVHKP
jgi:hypothetical protein